MADKVIKYINESFATRDSYGTQISTIAKLAPPELFSYYRDILIDTYKKFVRGLTYQQAEIILTSIHQLPQGYLLKILREVFPGQAPGEIGSAAAAAPMPSLFASSSIGIQPPPFSAAAPSAAPPLFAAAAPAAAPVAAPPLFAAAAPAAAPAPARPPRAAAGAGGGAAPVAPPRRMTEAQYFKTFNPYGAPILHPAERETAEEYTAGVLAGMKKNNRGGRRSKSRRSKSRRRRS